MTDREPVIAAGMAERAARALWLMDYPETPWEMGPLHELLRYRARARVALEAGLSYLKENKIGVTA
jgi:hypothetical protein